MEHAKPHGKQARQFTRDDVARISASAINMVLEKLSEQHTVWEGKGARHHSQSEADFTLVLMLLYWTNGDSSQVDRLFRQSGLMRDKWNRPVKAGETYGERIIKDAIQKSIS